MALQGRSKLQFSFVKLKLTDRPAPQCTLTYFNPRRLFFPPFFPYHTLPSSSFLCSGSNSSGVRFQLPAVYFKDNTRHWFTPAEAQCWPQNNAQINCNLLNKVILQCYPTIAWRKYWSEQALTTAERNAYFYWTVKGRDEDFVQYIIANFSKCIQTAYKKAICLSNNKLTW